MVQGSFRIFREHQKFAGSLLCTNARERRDAGMYAQMHCAFHEDYADNPLDAINMLGMARDAVVPLVPLWVLALLTRAGTALAWVLCMF